MSMTAREKLYFLLDKIDDLKSNMTPLGQPVIIDPVNDLNGKYRLDELLRFFTKLQNDKNVLKVLKIPSRIKEIDEIENLDPYEHADDGCWYIDPLPTFENYYLAIQYEPEYQRFTGKKPPIEQDKLKAKYKQIINEMRTQRNSTSKLIKRNNKAIKGAAVEKTHTSLKRGYSRLEFYRENGLAIYKSAEWNFKQQGKGWALLDMLNGNKNTPYTVDEIKEKCNPNISVKKHHFRKMKDIRDTVEHIKDKLKVNKNEYFPILKRENHWIWEEK